MKDFLYSYHIDDYEKDLSLTILVLCHELRVINAHQIFRFVNKYGDIKLNTIQKKLNKLKNKNLIGSFKSSNDVKTKIYYLEKLGYQSIQGYYPLTKVPEYNWYHCLMINDTLLDVVNLVGEHPHLQYIQTERRQVYEIKDMEKNKNGSVFVVADYLLRFQSAQRKNINWYFEIELTAKTKKRYKRYVFVKYINYLTKNKAARLFYVTPSKTINEELKKYRDEINRMVVDRTAADEVFSRFHIFMLDEFQEALQKIIATDPFINWQEET